MNEAATIGLRSVNVALPAYLCQRHGEMIASGIRKQPVATSTVYVSPTNIDGDGQGDLVAHGGVEKAVYAYPSEHWLPWTEEIGPSEPYGAGSFGENLSLTGLCEDEACIGDIWSWGDVRLQICQPRYPCYKLGVVLGYPKVVAMMVRNGRTGWYLRVLTAGEAPTSGAIELESRDPAGVTVAQAHLARLPGADRALIERVVAVDALASRLKRDFCENLSTSLEAAADRGA
ncbi:MAG: MOSC domain-containing protein [Thermomicrobiales bacterium]|nr:MOSC domain-containing protein [Thermomicrobiales bacterium]